MKKFKKINNEVYYTEKKITQIDDKDILFLKSNVHKTKKNTKNMKALRLHRTTSRM